MVIPGVRQFRIIQAARRYAFIVATQ